MINIDEFNSYMAKVKLPYKFEHSITHKLKENIVANKPIGNESFNSDIGLIIRNENEISFISSRKDPRLLFVIACIIDVSTGINQQERNDILHKIGMYDGSFAKSRKLQLKGYEFRVNYSKAYGLMFQIFSNTQ